MNLGPSIVSPPPKLPPWAQVAWADLGLREVRGGEHPRILQAHAQTTLGAREDEVPWCSAIMCLWMAEARIPHPRSARARAWLEWGVELGAPVPGCVAVLWRGTPNAATGHVGIYLGHRDDRVVLLGGNQGDQVSIQSFAAAQVISYRWPALTGGDP